jgi:pyridoxamine 5'-phosphate oxidase
MSDSFRRQLRALPDFPDTLPGFDPDTAPADPAELFQQWLDEALAAGELQPHACSVATVDGQGQPSSRMLILKNIDDDGWHFATSRTSRKGSELGGNPRAALNFYWPSSGPAGQGSGARGGIICRGFSPRLGRAPALRRQR